MPYFGRLAQQPAQINPANLSGPGVDAGYFRVVRDAAGMGTDPVPGPLGIWEPPSGRPYQQMGKFSVGLTGTPALQPLGFSPYAVPTEATHAGERQPGEIAPEQPGFFESMFGGLFGIAGEIPGTVGRFFGTVLDTPFEAAGNVAGLAAAPLNAAWLANQDKPLDADLQKYWDDSIRTNPLNALLKMGQVARYQWERDVKSGRTNGLLSDIGPAANPWDMLMTALNLVIVKPGQVVERGMLGLGVGDDRVKAAQDMANGLTVDPKILRGRVPDAGRRQVEVRVLR